MDDFTNALKEGEEHVHRERKNLVLCIRAIQMLHEKAPEDMQLNLFNEAFFAYDLAVRADTITHLMARFEKAGLGILCIPLARVLKTTLDQADSVNAKAKELFGHFKALSEVG